MPSCLSRLALFGWSRCRLIIVVASPGTTVFSACAASAIRGAIRTGRVRAAVIIQPAASSEVRAGKPSYSLVGAIIGVATSG